jgi:hypothetical protein
MQSLDSRLFERLEEAGINTLEKLVSISKENLSEIVGLESSSDAEILLGTVAAFLESRQEDEVTEETVEEEITDEEELSELSAEEDTARDTSAEDSELESEDHRLQTE